MPANAGIQGHAPQHRANDSWIPAFAGMTMKRALIQSDVVAL
jgi:hypothetical protein